MNAICTIEEAADEIIAAIKEGATLHFCSGILEDLRTTYLSRLELAESLGIHWSDARKRVLPLAYMVGAVATMLAAADQALTKSTAPPKQVLPSHAWGAAYLVSHVCQYPLDGGPGKICCDMPHDQDQYSWPQGRDKGMIDGLINIFQVLNLVPGYTSSTKVKKDAEQTSTYPPPPGSSA